MAAEDQGAAQDHAGMPDQLARMLAELCRLVERGYDPAMLRRVEGLMDWYAQEKMRQDEGDGGSNRDTDIMRRHYARLASDMERCDADTF